MRWVLLPGLDGSGRLFGDFLRRVPDSAPIVLSYPDEPGWKLDDYVRHVKAMLPAADCIVVAESFSGPIALRVARDASPIRALVLVASFVRCPNPILRVLPARLVAGLARWLAIGMALRILCLGRDASEKIVGELKSVVARMPSRMLGARLSLLRALDREAALGRSEKPMLVLRARHDRLVTEPLAHDTGDPQATLAIIDGPHFLLQTRPAECWRAIEAWRRTLP